MIRCKFTVASVTETIEGASVVMLPVISGSDENKEFWKWTPAGKLEFQTINKTIASELIPGKDYYIDIHES